MLGLTRDALKALQSLMEELPDGGVRIRAGARRFTRADAPAIQLESAPGADVEDTVLELEGMQIYLDPETYRLLDDKILDADLSGTEPRFAIHVDPSRARVEG